MEEFKRGISKAIRRKLMDVIVYLDTNIFLFLLSIFPNLIFFFF